MISKDTLRQCSAEIRKVKTLKIWARENNLNYTTVIHFLTGISGKWQVGKSAEIIAALRKDGFLDNVA